MSLIIRSDFNGVTDPDAAAYIAAVEAADGQLLEFAVGKAINDFVVGCKADGIWASINWCLVLCGARTIDGALLPLKGPKPTNVNLTIAEYDRKTGLSGNSSNSAYLNSNYNAASDPRDDYHCSVFTYTASGFSTVLDAGQGGAGATTITTTSVSNVYGFRSRSNLSSIGPAGPVRPSFAGLSRNNSASFLAINGSTSSEITRTSATSYSRAYWLFASSLSATPANYNNTRVTFASAGRSLDLALLGSRVTTLYNAIGSAF